MPHPPAGSRGARARGGLLWDGQPRRVQRAKAGLARAFGIGPAIRGEVQRGGYRIRRSLNWMGYSGQVRLDWTPLLSDPAAFGVLGVKANFTYRPIEGLTVRVVCSVEHGALQFTGGRASAALRVLGYHSVAVFTTRLGFNDIILLE